MKYYSCFVVIVVVIERNSFVVKIVVIERNRNQSYNSLKINRTFNVSKYFTVFQFHFT